eukprot:8627686-Pyramimonas_sp.AAC.1
MVEFRASKFSTDQKSAKGPSRFSQLALQRPGITLPAVLAASKNRSNWEPPSTRIPPGPS